MVRRPLWWRGHRRAAVATCPGPRRSNLLAGRRRGAVTRRAATVVLALWLGSAVDAVASAGALGAENCRVDGFRAKQVLLVVVGHDACDVEFLLLLLVFEIKRLGLHR